MQEEVENRSVNLAITTTKLTARAICSGIRKYVQHRGKVKSRKAADKAAKKAAPIRGKQTVKQLIRQNQGVSSVDIAIPYVILGLLATNLGEAWRLAVGTDISEKILALFATIPTAFGNPLPSMYPADLCVGLVCGAVLRIAVYLRGKNAKKYRHNVEYGSARWSA